MQRRLIAAALLVAACAPAEEAPPPPVEPQQAAFTASEFAFAGPDTLAPGVTSVTFRNDGSQLHHMILARLDDGKTAADFGAFMAENPTGIPDFVSWRGASGGVEPGGNSTSIIDLPAGTYLLLCFVADPADGTAHIEKGMMRELVVAGEPVGAPAPVADGEIRMKDFEFGHDSIAAGSHLFHVINDGPSIHEVDLVRLHDGATAESFLAAVAPGSVDPPPGTPMGGTGALSPGLSNWWPVDLSPGTYLFICWVPDAEGVPHAMLGMVKTVVVE
jgi:uncharacterized cupredoxin-like copper-binding protein